MARAKSNEYTAFVKKMLHPEDTAGFFPTVEILSKEQMTLEYILERVEPYMKEISAEYSVSYLLKQHELKVAEIKRERIDTLYAGKAGDGTEGTRRIGWVMNPREFFKEGRDALRAVSEQFGPWNWMFWRPSTEEGGEPELITGGCDSLQEMRTYLSEHLDESMFGLLRMGFGVGRLRRTKHVFVHAVGPQASAVKRGKIGGQLSRMKQWVEESKHVSVHIEVEDETALTEEEVVARVRKAAHLDEEEVPGDEGLKDIFTVEAMQQAHMEERTKMQLPGEAEALEEVAETQRQQWMNLPLDELLRLFHYEGAPNWVLFGPGESWSEPGTKAPLPGYLVQSLKLKPGRGIGAADIKGGFMQAEERRRSKLEELAAQKAYEGPPVATVGNSACKNAGSELSAQLARRREKHLAAMGASPAETVEEETEEQAAETQLDLPLTTTKAAPPPLTTTKESGGDPLTQSSLGQDLSNAAGSMGQAAEPLSNLPLTTTKAAQPPLTTTQDEGKGGKKGGKGAKGKAGKSTDPSNSKDCNVS